MATRNIVPRADEEGGIGTALKKWLYGYIKTLAVTTINTLTLTSQTIGFTIAGGTTPKTLTVDETVAMSDKAAKTHGALHLPSAADPIGLPKFSAHKNGTAQTGVVNNTNAKVTFTTEEYDIGGTYDAPNSKWTPGIIGKAHISAGIHWNTAVSQTVLVTRIFKNSVNYKESIMQASGNNLQSVLVSCDVLIDAVTDYFEIYVYQESGGNKDISGALTATWFMGHMLP